MERTYCVYIHKTPSNKVYIGQTCMRPELRWANGKGYNDNPYFSNAITKYGWDNILHFVVGQELSAEEADTLEKQLIDKYNAANPDYGYNIQFGGHGGQVHSEETKAKLSAKMKRIYGGTFTEEHKQALSDAKRGKCSDAVKQVCLSNSKKLSEKGMSSETKDKISKSKRGKPGRVWTEEDRLKHSARMKQVYSSK